MRRYPIPRRLYFPFGYVVSVRQVTQTELRAQYEGDAIDGLWDSTIRVIWIDKNITMTRKRYVLIHEAQHALTDMMLWAIHEGLAHA